MLSHTRVRPDRACLCGDPNEGRQASKLGRAAAARAAILLESGWKSDAGAGRGGRSIGWSVGADLSVLSNRTSLLLSSRDSPAGGGEDQVGAGCHVAGGEEEGRRINTWSGTSRGRGREGGRKGEGETIVR